jgi:hypothetical protein
MRVCGVTTAESADVLLAAGAEHAIRSFEELPATLRTQLGL